MRPRRKFRECETEECGTNDASDAHPPAPRGIDEANDAAEAAMIAMGNDGRTMMMNVCVKIVFSLQLAPKNKTGKIDGHFF